MKFTAMRNRYKEITCAATIQMSVQCDLLTADGQHSNKMSRGK